MSLPKQRIPPIMSREEPPKPPLPIWEKRGGVNYEVAQISVDLLPPFPLRGNAALSKRNWEYREAARGWALLWEAPVREWLRMRGWPVDARIDPAEATVTFVVPDKRKRDGENYIQAMKSVWDMMCGYPRGGKATKLACRLLLGDDYFHLTVGPAQFVVDKAQAPRTIIELRRVELVDRSGGATMQQGRL